MEAEPELKERDDGDGETGKALVVVLVGAPGSGKSTFCEDVMGASARSWTRICQDSIANGKPGTKSQCIKSATEALKQGKSIFIDRCNIDRSQRADFMGLAGQRSEVHAVVLNLPARVCISRSVKRSGHEGNLQGGRAAAVVNKMLQNLEPPQIDEGFSRITFCPTEPEVNALVNAYSSLGPADSLPHGCFGKKNPDSKVQLGIARFLKKAEKNPHEKNLQESSSSIPTGNSPFGESERKKHKGDEKHRAPWAEALHRLAMEPDKDPHVLLEVTDDFIVLPDLYPKAKKHVLVVSREENLDSLADVERKHQPLLRKLHEAAMRWTSKFLEKDPSLTFRLGYHSVPSMRQLHLHVISQDLDSEHMKNKKHWNSFTTAFFRDSVDVIAEVEREGGVASAAAERLLVAELRCHRCRSAQPSLPKLKAHASRCRAAFPGHLLQGGRLVTAAPPSDGDGTKLQTL
ncbi:APRATAXIN-like protein isoform X2 [Wolffia australiana]